MSFYPNPSILQPKRAPSTARTSLSGSVKSEIVAPTYRNALAFDARDLNGTEWHTAPYMIPLTRNKRAVSLPQAYNHNVLRRRGYYQASAGDLSSVLQGGQRKLIGVPGYTGYIPGSTIMKQNQECAEAVLLREPPHENEYRQTTQKFLSDDQRRAIRDKDGERIARGAGGMTFDKSLCHRADEAKQLLDEHKSQDAKRMFKCYRTWAEPTSYFSKPHQHWKRGIVGYTGHFPHWAKEKFFYEKKIEVGKHHPPYLPSVTFNTIVQPP